MELESLSKVEMFRKGELDGKEQEKAPTFRPLKLRLYDRCHVVEFWTFGDKKSTVE